MNPPPIVGETVVTTKNRISIPAEAVRLLGWKKGARLLKQILGDDLVLMRRPKSFTEAFAGRLAHVFGGHENTLRYLEEERRSWEDEDLILGNP